MGIGGLARSLSPANCTAGLPPPVSGGVPTKAGRWVSWPGGLGRGGSLLAKRLVQQLRDLVSYRERLRFKDLGSRLEISFELILVYIVQVLGGEVGDMARH